MPPVTHARKIQKLFYAYLTVWKQLPSAGSPNFAQKPNIMDNLIPNTKDRTFIIALWQANVACLTGQVVFLTEKQMRVCNKLWASIGKYYDPHFNYNDVPDIFYREVHKVPF